MKTVRKVSKKVLGRLNQIIFSELLLTLTILSNSILVISAIIATSYYGLTVIGTGWDGWCDTKVTGIGTHCFGDYATMPLIGVTENPWISEYVIPWNYPAAAMLFTYFFVRVGLFFHNPQLGLIFYLISLAIALVIPAIWASRGKKFFLKLIALTLIGVTSIPALTALDRGNHVGFVVPALLLFLVGIDRNSWPLTVAGIVIAAMVKPQFALILLVPLLLFRWKVVLYSILGIAVTQLIPFLLWPADFPRTVFQALSNMLAYGGVPVLADTFPTNSSIVSSIYEFFALFGSNDETNPVLVFIQTNQLPITLLLLAFYCLWVVLLRNSYPPILLAIYLCAFSSTVVPVSWSYYLVFAIAVTAVMLRDPKSKIFEKDKFSGILEREEFNAPEKRLSSIVLVIAGALTLSKVIIPNLEMTMGYYPVNSGELTTVFWVISAYVSLLSWTIYFLRSRNKFQSTGTRLTADLPIE